jgi:hypothetical protein
MPREQYRTVVKRENPRRQRLRVFAGLSIVIAVTGVAYFWGENRASQRPIPWNGESEVLREELALLATRAELDTQAIADLTISLAEARGVIEERERELAFYQEVLAPEEITRGPRLRQPVFRATERPGVWRYQLVVQHGGKTSSGYRGDLKVIFTGVVAGAVSVLPLTELDLALSGSPLALNFRYFQRVEGELEFPPGFTPEQVEVVLELSKPTSEDIRTGYIWDELVVR